MAMNLGLTGTERKNYETGQQSFRRPGQDWTAQSRHAQKACRGKTGWWGEQKQYKSGDKLKKE